MRILEISEASLADYDPKADEGTWVLTRRGKPVAAVVPIRAGVDAEGFALSHNEAFIEIINRSWATYQKKGGISLDEARRKYGRRPATSRRRARTPR